jgi:phosphoserine phosphatase
MRLRRVKAVVFDCDSTLSAIEGIDELAAAVRARGRGADERRHAR